MFILTTAKLLDNYAFYESLFAFVYLPIVFVGFFALGRYSPRYAATWLFLASVVFYGYWLPKFTILLLGSICCNFWVGSRISSLMSSENGREKNARRWLIGGIAVNLALLGYFKYANFFLDNLMLVSSEHWDYEHIILPIGISFFTFTQIAFLADTFQKGVKEYAFIHYGLFVTYFPHLLCRTSFAPRTNDASVLRRKKPIKLIQLMWPAG